LYIGPRPDTLTPSSYPPAGAAGPTLCEVPT